MVPRGSFGSNLDDVRAIYLYGHPLVAPMEGPPISTLVETARNALTGWEQ